MIHRLFTQRTRDLHSSLEARPGVLLRDELSVGQYAAIQKSFYGFYKPLEDRLAAFVGRQDPELRLEKRLKLPLLVGDLASLEDPPVGTLSEVLGCLYVPEGSTLGGRIVIRHLRACGENAGRMWSTFLGFLARHCEEYGDQEAIVNSACQIIGCLERWFSLAGISA